MPTIKLQISEKSFSRFMKMLDAFNVDEISVIDSDAEILALKQELKKIEDGSANFLTIDQAEKRLDAVIKRYES